MYEQLVKSLRICGDSVDAIDECCYEECIQHKRPIDPLCMQALCNKAADAIEELSMKLHGDEAAIAGMKREIERMVVAGKPRWVSVEERLPENFKKVLVFWTSESEPMMDTAFWHETERRFDCEHWVGSSGKITHWMLLPEPPKEESDG